MINSSSFEQFQDAVFEALGAAPDDIDPGRLHRFSTNGKRRDTSGWCRLFEDGRAGVYGDFRTGLTGVWTATSANALSAAERREIARQVARARAERLLQQRQSWAENAERNTRTWGQCRPLLQGDPVARYLQRRGFGAAWPLPQCLRFHPALRYRHDDDSFSSHPAMVAPLTAPDGRIVALHRTYLTGDGRKADVPTVKKLTSASGSLAGACIRLADPRRGAIGIAEGIETALGAACCSDLPVVAAYSAGNLAAWKWPWGVRRLVIFADHDEAGQKAAQALCERARAARLSSSVLTPTAADADWCDVWARSAGQEVVA